MRKFIIFIAIAFCTSTLALASEQFDKLLTQFESSSGSQQVAIANQLMKTLNDEQFTDELYQFSTTTTP